MFAWRLKRTTSKEHIWAGMTSFSAVTVTQLKLSTSLSVHRLIQLMEEIMAEKENKTIIFVETKKRCDDLTRRMRRDGWEMTNNTTVVLGWMMQIWYKRQKGCHIAVSCSRWPAMCIHGDKSQPERDWVLTGKSMSHLLLTSLSAWISCSPVHLPSDYSSVL